MIYLASPYSNAPETNVKHAAEAATFLLLKRNLRVFSPILHWHEAAKWAALPGDAEFWWWYNVGMLRKSDDMIVLIVDGWNRSVGVKKEIDWWETHRLTSPNFLDPAEYRKPT